MKDTGYLMNTLKSMKQVSNPASQLPDILGLFWELSTFCVVEDLDSQSPTKSRGWLGSRGGLGWLRCRGECDLMPT